MDNYICLDGVKVLLNDSQISELRAALEKDKKKEPVKDSPFNKQSNGENYFYISTIGEVSEYIDLAFSCDSHRYDIANYCTDEELLKQRALEEILARRLWRYSMEHDGDKVDWKKNQTKYTIYYNHENDTFYATHDLNYQTANAIYFSTKEAASNAIKEVVVPFMKEYPGFKNYRP